MFASADFAARRSRVLRVKLVAHSAHTDGRTPDGRVQGPAPPAESAQAHPTPDTRQTAEFANQRDLKLPDFCGLAVEGGHGGRLLRAGCGVQQGVKPETLHHSARPQRRPRQLILTDDDTRAQQRPVLRDDVLARAGHEKDKLGQERLVGQHRVELSRPDRHVPLHPRARGWPLLRDTRDASLALSAHFAATVCDCRDPSPRLESDDARQCPSVGRFALSKGTRLQAAPLMCCCCCCCVMMDSTRLDCIDRPQATHCVMIREAASCVREVMGVHLTVVSPVRMCHGLFCVRESDLLL